MTKYQETAAFAILRTGGSFEDAANISGASVEEIQKEWAQHFGTEISLAAKRGIS